MNETYKIIQKIKQRIKDDIEDCGYTNPSLEPITYGVVLGLKGALANIKAIETIYCQEEEEENCFGEKSSDYPKDKFVY